MKSDKKIKRKICVLAILGMFAAIMLSPTAVAPPDPDTNVPAFGSYSINIDSNNDETDRIFRVTHDGDPGSELFRVQETGEVGIGTASPDKLLHLGDDTNNIDGELRFEASNGHYVDLGITTADKFYITGGNVGIGTTGPVSTLSVAGEVIVGTTWAFTAPPPPIGGMIIEGNVGIGTDSPVAKLDVYPTVTTINDYIGIRSDMTFDPGIGIMNNWYGAYIAAPLAITGSITNKYALVTESGAGNVGIGTTSPTGKLDVNGDDIRIRTLQTPASATADGYTGEIAWDSNNIYVCILGDGPGGNADAWKKVTISTW